MILTILGLHYIPDSTHLEIVQENLEILGFNHELPENAEIDNVPQHALYATDNMGDEIKAQLCYYASMNGCQIGTGLLPESNLITQIAFSNTRYQFE